MHKHRFYCFLCVLFACNRDEFVDPIGYHLKALAPELGVCEVYTRDVCNVFNGVYRGGVKQGAVFGKESLALLEILCVESAREQTAKGVGEVIIAQSCAEIVALAAPHIGMHIVGIERVTERLSLRVKHDLLKILCKEEGGLAAADDLVLEQEARVDVNDDLCAVLKLTLDKLQLFLALCLVDSIVYADKLVKV